MFEPHEIPWVILGAFVFLYLVIFTIRNIWRDKKDGK